MHAVIDTPVGELTLVRDDDGLTGVYFPGHRPDPDRTAFGPRVDPGADSLLAAAANQLGEYFAGDRHEFNLRLNPHGSDRARQVWKLITDIPHGGTTTYGALAAQAGGGISARAIGGFVGHNPLSILIGCHRVVGSTGRLTGYAGGLRRKQQLLELESSGSTDPLW